MKKLFILAFLTSVACADTDSDNSIQGDFKEVGLQFAQVVTEPAKEIAQTIKESDAGDVLGQIFVDAPQQLAENVRDAAKAVATTTKDAADKVANSRFVKKVKKTAVKTGDAIAHAARTTGTAIKDTTKKAADAIVDTTKKSVTAVKDTAHNIAHSEGGQDVKEVLLQFAAVPKEAWETITELF